MAEKREGNNLSDSDVNRAVNSAVEYFMGKVMQQNPMINHDNIPNYIDSRKIGAFANQLRCSDELAEMDEQDKYEAIVNGIMGFLGSREGLTPMGRAIISRGGLEARVGKESPGKRTWKGEQGRDYAIQAAKDIYNAMDKTERELAPDYIETLAGMAKQGIAAKSAHIYQEYGLISPETHEAIMDERTQRIGEGVEKMVGMTKSYVVGEQDTSPSSYKAAAAVIGLVGIGIILASETLTTGNVIGGGVSVLGSGIIGAAMILTSLIFLLKRNKKKASEYN